MKHLWVVESSGGRKWNPGGAMLPLVFFSRKAAKREAANQAEDSPGLKWRVARYEREKP